MEERNRENYRRITAKLARLRTAWRANEAARGLMTSMMALMMPPLVALACGAAGAARAVIVLAALCAAALLFVALFLYPLLRPLSLKDAAYFAENKYPLLLGKAVSSIELFAESKANKESFDASRLSALLEETDAAMSGLGVVAALNTRATKATAGAFVASCAAIAAAIYLGLVSTYGLFAYMSPPYAPSEEKYALEWITGDIEAPANGRVVIEARFSGTMHSAPMATLERAGLEPRVERMKRADKKQNAGAAEFYIVIDPLPGDMSYSVAYKKLNSKKFMIKAVEPPTARSMKLNLEYPNHTGIRAEERTGGGDIRVPFGTRVAVTVESASRLGEARLVFEDGDATDLEIDTAAHKATGVFTVKKSVRYAVVLKDERGFENSNPPKYRVESAPDMSPEISILIPEKDIDAPRNSVIAVRGEARDDYRVNAVSVHLKVLGAGREETVQINVRPGKELLFEFPLNLGELGVFEGDTLEFYLSATDNDALTGPKTARSETRRARVLSSFEDYREILRKQDDIESGLESLLGEGRGLAEKVEDLARNLTREMRDDGARQWKAEAARALERSKALDSELANISKKLDETIERMKSNELVNLDTVSKMNELNNLMRDIMTDEIRELMEQIGKQLERASLENIDARMMEAMKDTRQALDNLDRTIQKMKRIRAEQKLAAAREQFKELAERQKKLLEKTEALDRAAGNKKPDAAQCSEAASQSREEARIHDRAKPGAAELKALAEEIRDASPETAAALKSAADVADRTRMAEQLAGARNSLGQCSLKPAIEQERAALEALEKMSEKLEKAAGEFAEQMSAREKEMIRRLLRGALDISAAHEETRGKTDKMMDRAGAKPAASEFKTLAEEQQMARQAAEALAQDAAALASFSMAVSQNAPIMAADAAQSLARSVESFAEMKLDQAASNQSAASLRLNQLAISLLEAKKRAGMESSASELESFMGRLQQLANSQQSLNEATDRLGDSGLPIPQMSAGMQSLALQQKLIAQGLGELSKEMESIGGMSERLKQIGDEMKTITSELEGGRVTGEVKRRQSNALRRLRESSLSLRKESLDEKRAAESAREHSPAVSPKAIDLTRDALPERILRQIEQLRREPSPEGYEQLIENYYKELLKGGN